VTHEVLVNVDTPEIRDGDVEILTPAVGTTGYVILSQNLGEVRAYNRLARMARGKYLVTLPHKSAATWLNRSLNLFRSQSLAERPLDMWALRKAYAASSARYRSTERDQPAWLRGLRHGRAG
jgi:hypothetical protein